MLSAVIIDDMPIAIEVLKADLKRFCSNVEVIGTADGVISGAKLLKEKEPDILFLDIQMKDGSGFDLLEIVNLNNCHIIFTTASNDHAIKAFQYSAIDYLLKPIQPDLLAAAVEKVSSFKTIKDEQLHILRESLQGSSKTERIVLHTLEQITIVPIVDILRCEAMGNYTQFYIAGNKKILVTRTLKEFEKLLGDHSFIRVHQSHLVNAAHIEAYVKTEGGYLKMDDGSNVPVSVRKKSYVIQYLETKLN